MSQGVAIRGGRKPTIAFVVFCIAAAPAACEAGSCDRARFHVVLDVGHTPDAPGAISARGRTELDFNRHLAEVIKSRLGAYGFSDVSVLVSPSGTSLPTRATNANALKPDLFISVHHDSVQKRYLQPWTFEGRDLAYSDRFKGWSLFVSQRNVRAAESLRFAQRIGRNLLAAGLPFSEHHAESIKGENRPFLDHRSGVYGYDGLVVLRKSTAPAVLMESGLIVNRNEEIALESSRRQDAIAGAIVAAVATTCDEVAPQR